MKKIEKISNHRTHLHVKYVTAKRLNTPQTLIFYHNCIILKRIYWSLPSFYSNLRMIFLPLNRLSPRAGVHFFIVSSDRMY
jgi:hypothetical protein